MSIKNLIDGTMPAKTPNRIGDLIEAERARTPETLTVDMTFGPTSAAVTLTELKGALWGDVARQAPRRGNTDDERLRANSDHLIEQYPVTHITIDGEHPTADQWFEIVALLDPPTRGDIVTAIWWMHYGRSIEEMRRVNAEKAEEATDG